MATTKGKEDEVKCTIIIFCSPWHWIMLLVLTMIVMMMLLLVPIQLLLLLRLILMLFVRWWWWWCYCILSHRKCTTCSFLQWILLFNHLTVFKHFLTKNSRRFFINRSIKNKSLSKQKFVYSIKIDPKTILFRCCWRQPRQYTQYSFGNENIWMDKKKTKEKKFKKKKTWIFRFCLLANL